MPNLGDVTLKLPPDFSRASLASGQEFMATAVCHEGGVSDLYLTGSPHAEHQFAWCDPKDVDRYHMLRSKRFEWIKADKWTKNEFLWEWDAENFVSHKGQRCMARAASYFHAEETARLRKQEEEARLRKLHRTRQDDADDYAVQRLGAQGAAVFDENNRELRPQKRAGR